VRGVLGNRHPYRDQKLAGSEEGLPGHPKIITFKVLQKKQRFQF
jgi:hypothetical protein